MLASIWGAQQRGHYRLSSGYSAFRLLTQIAQRCPDACYSSDLETFGRSVINPVFVANAQSMRYRVRGRDGELHHRLLHYFLNASILTYGEEIDLPIIATAAWSIPKTVADRFAREGSGLTRYASVFAGVEINSTFYHRHKPSTFARWAESVPNSFRFSVKIPKEITHVRAMKDIGEQFNTFLEDIAPLDKKRGPLLFQLPPSLAFDPDEAGRVACAYVGGRVMIQELTQESVLFSR